MGKTLITGGTGFVGSHVARAVARRGDEVRILIRRDSGEELLSGIDYERAVGDVTDRRAVRRAVDGVDTIFHVAGVTSFKPADAGRLFDVNVGGTRILCEEAVEAGARRLVHTSSAAAIGPAAPKGRADEQHPFTAGSLGIPYINSKREAEMEVLRAGAHGLDTVIVNPTFVLGPGGRGSSSMNLVKRFLMRRVPVYVDGGLNIVDVRDVAAGHLLAEASGGRGERYILGGRNFTLQRLFADLARIADVPAPAVRLPAPMAVGSARFAEQLGLPLGLGSDEARSASLWWTYSPAKAKRELGFSARPHEETLEAAVVSMREQLGDRVGGELGRVDSAIDLASRMAGLAGRINPF